MNYRRKIKDRSASPDELAEKRRKAYGYRNRILRSMGFNSYDAYLKSFLWQRIRSEQLQLKPFCWACGGIATQIHHKKYFRRDLDGTRRRNLLSLCGNCHYGSEFRIKDGLKVSPAGANRVLRKKRLHKFGGVRNRYFRPNAKAKLAIDFRDALISSLESIASLA